jgi:hypothetical protein
MHTETKEPDQHRHQLTHPTTCITPYVFPCLLMICALNMPSKHVVSMFRPVTLSLCPYVGQDICCR